MLTLPAPFTPRILIIVNSHNIPEVIKKAGTGLAVAGIKYVKYSINAVMIAAFPTQAPIQYVQAIRNPAKSPNAARVYTIGPPVLGNAVPRLAKLKAISKEPAAVIIHAIIAVLGFDAAASEAAEVKIPEPIQLPTTIATAAARPSSRFNSKFPVLPASILLFINASDYSYKSILFKLISII
jgi:hypothetical protein